MKSKGKNFPILFLIFGLILVGIISTVSIKNYVRMNSGKKVIHQGILFKENEGEKIFFKKPSASPNKTSIKIYKSKRVMELYGDGNLIGRFKIGLGRVPQGKKEAEGDKKTPEGDYYICYINSQTKYTYFLGISYPNVEDAQNALDKNIINRTQYERIKYAIKNKKQPPWNTPLGGAIGIHGGGSKYNWTYGCVALSNEDMNILKKYAHLETSVKIYK
ncbi:murein L,D-transpeptidase family protein [Clostridium sp. MT-14]|uniref:L,D-transpeptidase family protein n=1 Tax=Clostridium aromativorans TaxID=2836848 RepID=A0ABS8N4W2_9CLOT|nr:MULTISPECIES: L,D-transpeptidase family protein [Clostridium]KAA8674322.1 L,D-transpeptidase [Clostridium sp. HV4-5-A1G]MCC9294844.1 L,D-transpeptidase family protein [Clostridium aromativorans]